ncbi:hypothetical protein C5167_050596 [Papaver somniferum]|uniref:Uncharacterized protein n=1 Tax=Papaver somniferum TaxID=3469 RepID=A0A4Y7KP31_PAPSO|nr:hypothetical protein C5167_050596 [Papaver somniferum]
MDSVKRVLVPHYFKVCRRWICGWRRLMKSWVKLICRSTCEIIWCWLYREWCEFWRQFLEDVKNKNIEIMGNTLYKAYLKDFFKFYQSREITVKMMVLTSTGFSRCFSNVTFAEIEDAENSGSKSCHTKGCSAKAAFSYTLSKLLTSTTLSKIKAQKLIVELGSLLMKLQLIGHRTLVCSYEIMNSPERACHLAKSAFKEAIIKMDT